jgi:RimJ/RimL family protein N-acetyltransferase
MLSTARLEIVSCGLPEFEALTKGKEHLGIHLGVRIPESWPNFPDSILYFHEPLLADESLALWGTWLAIEKSERILIGEGGYGGKPNSDGVVEIGYGIIPDYRKLGFATEYAAALIKNAFGNPTVNTIEAGTLKSGDDSLASARVLEKLGFTKSHETQVAFRWSLSRDHFEEPS